MLVAQRLVFRQPHVCVYKSTSTLSSRQYVASVGVAFSSITDRSWFGTSSPRKHILSQALLHGNRPAVGTTDPNQLCSNGNTLTYHQILQKVVGVAETLTQRRSFQREGRIAFLCPREPSYVIAQWSIWAAGGVAVPLHPQHPLEEMKYVVQDSEAQVIICSLTCRSVAELVARELGIEVMVLDDELMNLGLASKYTHLTSSASVLKNVRGDAMAQILYTSGTTGRPKGVVSTHDILSSQVEDVVKAWQISSQDRILHFLPLHHTHGILCKLLAPMWAGGYCEFMTDGKPLQIWTRLANISKRNEPAITLFMAVPTIYANLLEIAPTLSPEIRNAAIDSIKKMRVNISGSMACPQSVINRWEALTGQRLLERYGMTELGMVLTNPLVGDRHVGYVGKPFPSVQACVIDPSSEEEVIPGVEGELRVRGPSVFKEYWKRADATEKAFDAHGWFKTGDIVEYDQQKESYRIRGRASVDIIKTGGYKVSAIDVERVILEHPLVSQCIVFGLPDEKWGEVIATIVVPVCADRLTRKEVLEFTRSRLADYKVPRKIKFMDEIPKNAMGKVNKKLLRTETQFD